jgi:hypothetical protein
MEFEGEGAKDPGHHGDVQSSPIDKQIGDVGEDVVIEGIATKHEKHEVTTPLVVGRRGFQNDCDNRSYVLEVDSLRMQVRDEGDIRVGASIDEAIVIVVLRDRDLLDSYELLFHVTDDGFSLSQVRVTARSRARASSRVLRVAATAAMRASCSQCAVAAAASCAAATSSSFLLVAATTAICCPSTSERLELLTGMVGKTVTIRGGGGWR